ncbi:MAG: lipoprotein [Sulfurimonadaceae bacterium]|nr:lipoprotein [Sulfurimonadaceae bacterium]
MLQMRKNLRTVFHGLIIASALLSLAGCGYKAPPYYESSKSE